MNSSTSDDLRTYIEQQRANGVSDDAILDTLVSSGWQRDVVVQALSTPREAALGEQKSDKPTSTLTVNNEKNIKKVKILGIMVIALGVISILELSLIHI